MLHSTQGYILPSCYTKLLNASCQPDLPGSSLFFCVHAGKLKGVLSKSPQDLCGTVLLPELKASLSEEDLLVKSDEKISVTKFPHLFI